jgi:hypothetical protein
MNCPKCNQPGAIECADEVDIGVGVQKFVFGYECQQCGPIVVCRSCGAPDFQPHAKWCAEFPSIEFYTEI